MPPLAWGALVAASIIAAAIFVLYVVPGTKPVRAPDKGVRVVRDAPQSPPRPRPTPSATHNVSPYPPARKRSPVKK